MTPLPQETSRDNIILCAPAGVRHQPARCGRQNERDGQGAGIGGATSFAVAPGRIPSGQGEYRDTTQAELAERLGVDSSVVCRDERNEYHGVTLERAAKILNAMRVELRTSVEVPGHGLATLPRAPPSATTHPRRIGMSRRWRPGAADSVPFLDRSTEPPITARSPEDQPRPLTPTAFRQFPQLMLLTHLSRGLTASLGQVGATCRHRK